MFLCTKTKNYLYTNNTSNKLYSMILHEQHDNKDLIQKALKNTRNLVEKETASIFFISFHEECTFQLTLKSDFRSHVEKYHKVKEN